MVSSSSPNPSVLNRILSRTAPSIIFVTLLCVTLLVLGQQLEHNRHLLARHTKDICIQAAERLRARLQSRLGVVSLFARRWSTHEERDFSRKRFQEFASVLIGEFPVFHTFQLVNFDADTQWVETPGGTQLSNKYFFTERDKLIEESRRINRILLSSPYKCGRDRKCIFSVMPLLRGQESLGFLIVEFSSDSLIKDVFHNQIQSEFNIDLKDEGKTLFSNSKDLEPSTMSERMKFQQQFQILNRTWRITMMPRKTQVDSESWLVHGALFLLGLVLSFGFSFLAYLLLKRMELYRIANQQILDEMHKREEAQSALGTTEARYRSVFNSATDGFLVIDQNDRIVEANKAANIMHGFPSGGLTGCNYQDLIAPDYKHLYDEFRTQLDRSGTVRLDSVHIKRAGETVDVEVRGTSFHFGGEPRILAIVTDVSDRKRAMQRQTMLSRKVLMAQEEERSRVSRDLHDELGQILTALHLELDILKKDLSEIPESVSHTFANALAMVEKAADELRHVCRGLRPPMLDDLGIEPALNTLVAEFQDRTRINTELIYGVKDEKNAVPLEVALCIYRIVQESLNNIHRHANAKEVEISFVEQNDEWVVSVIDNGDGFDMNAINQSKGCGIAGMKERALLVNGSLEIHSVPSEGTRLQLRIPRSDSNKE